MSNALNSRVDETRGLAPRVRRSAYFLNSKRAISTRMTSRFSKGNFIVPLMRRTETTNFIFMIEIPTDFMIEFRVAEKGMGLESKQPMLG